MPPKKKLKKRPKAGAAHEAPKPLIIDEGLEHQELEFDGRKALRKKTSSMGGFHSGQRRDALPSSAALMVWYNEPLKKKYRGTFVYRRWLWPYIYKPRRNRRLMKQYGYVPSEAEIERIMAGCVKGKTPLLKMMRFVGINETQAARFLKLFEQVDKDHSGTIDIQEFFGFFKMPVTDFAKASFRVMDFEKTGDDDHGDGELSYAEFFASLYNYASLTDTSLLKFTFDVIDADGSGEVSKSELFDMVRMMYMDKSGKDVQRTVSQLMNVLDSDHDGDITFAEFQRAHRKVGTLIYPAYQMQRGLRERCLTQKFWKAAEKRRAKIEVAGGCSVIDLYRGIVAMEESEDEAAGEADEDDSDSDDSFMSLDDDDFDHIDEMRAQVRSALGEAGRRRRRPGGGGDEGG